MYFLSGALRQHAQSVELLFEAQIARKGLSSRDRSRAVTRHICRLHCRSLSARVTLARTQTDVEEDRYAFPNLVELTNAFTDPNMEVIKPYLLAACKYFNQKKAFKTLVTFQVFMKDYLRAGLTCIKIFMETLDPQYKLKCLEVAKGYFEEGLKLRQQTKGVKVSTEVSNEVLQESDVNKYLNRIDLQLELLQFLIPRYKDIAIEGFEQFTLFGNQVQRQALAEYVILHDVDLGIDVIDDAKLDRMSVLTASIANLGKSLIAAITNKTDPAAEMKRIDDFLTALKVRSALCR
jgi:hypothetical protein